jgi:hypothetical protein
LIVARVFFETVGHTHEEVWYLLHKIHKNHFIISNLKFYNYYHIFLDKILNIFIPLNGFYECFLLTNLIQSMYWIKKVFEARSKTKIHRLSQVLLQKPNSTMVKN